jgi:hypothetical protein
MTNEFIIDFIRDSDNTIKEFDLIKRIKSDKPNFFISLSENPSLFKQHFYLFHQLYLLKEEMIGSGHSLVISSIAIGIESENSCSNMALVEPEGLKDFYLDLDNLDLSDKEVTLMINAFWEKYCAIDKKADAINILGLQYNKKLDILSIKSAYNKLAHTHHPDKGGSEEVFLEIKKAYEVLKVLHS